MMIVPGASLPLNDTVSRGMGDATGCNCESRALANTDAVPALRKRPARTAARNRVRRMGSLFDVIPRTHEKRNARGLKFPPHRDAFVDQLWRRKGSRAMFSGPAKAQNQPFELN